MGAADLTMLERIQRELAYNTWANWETLNSLSRARNVPERAESVMAHLIAAEWLWMGRLGHGSQAMSVWPKLSRLDFANQLSDLSREWQAYLEKLDSASLLQEVRYTNSKGEDWSNAVVDILTHVVLHSSYHRGQVATLLGRTGEQAAYTDYIECIRRDHLAGGWPQLPTR
jgi:uncharacterized damage-inducible protein DinB